MILNTQPEGALPEASDHASGALGVNIRRSIESPFAPLLASLESLGKEFPAGDGRAMRLGNAVEMLESVRHAVQALVDLIAPQDQHPSTCTLEELARCGLRALPNASRGRVQLAIENAHSVCRVDCARFSRCLSYLLLANLPADRDTMFHVCCDGKGASFSLLAPSNNGLESRVEPPELQPGEQADEFMQLVAERELVRLGGSFERHERAHGALQLTVQLPLLPANGEIS